MESEPIPTNSHENKGENPLSKERAKNLFLMSFYFSQGDGDEQSTIYNWLHAVYPNYKIDDEITNYIKSEALRIIPKIVPSTIKGDEAYVHVNAPRINILENVTKQLFEMKRALNTNVDRDIIEITRGDREVRMPSREYYAEQLYLIFLERDYKWLIEKGGRPRQNTENSQSLIADKYLSHVCKYALEAHTTGTPEYDQMFKDIAKIIRKESKQHGVDERLKEVIKIYKQHHRDIKITIHPSSKKDVLKKGKESNSLEPKPSRYAPRIEALQPYLEDPNLSGETLLGIKHMIILLQRNSFNEVAEVFKDNERFFSLERDGFLEEIRDIIFTKQSKKIPN